MRPDSSSSLSTALFLKTLRRLLAVLFAKPDRSVHLHGIVATTCQSPGTVQRILERLTKAGIVIRERQGNQVLFQANPDCLIFPELFGITIKAVGFAEPIRSALQPLAGRILFAFIIGNDDEYSELASERLAVQI